MTKASAAAAAERGPDPATDTNIVFQSQSGYWVSNSSLLMCFSVGETTQNGLKRSMSMSCSSGLMAVSTIQ